jgi:uncharacterized protein YjbI with pentapeptide repeats
MSKDAGTRTNVFWKEDEIQKVSLRFAELMHEAESEDRYLSFIGAMEQAQNDTLDVSRHRPRKSLQTGGAKFSDMIRSTGAKLLKAKKAAQAEEDRQFARYQADQAKRESTSVVTPKQHVEDVTLQPTNSSTIAPQYRWDEMISALVQSITENFRVQLTSSLNAATNETFENIHVQISSELVDIEKTALNKISDVLSTVEKAKKKKVVVIGIGSDQFHELENEYGHYVNLDFIDSKKSNRLKAAAQRADFVIANLASVSHHHSNILKNHPGLRRANGGSGSVKDLLLEIVTG